MSNFDTFLLYAVYVALVPWILWGFLHVIDYPITYVAKSCKSYWLLVEYCLYRKKFKAWIKDAKVRRVNSETGAWETGTESLPEYQRPVATQREMEGK